MRHDLLGYLLGALDADERVAIENQLLVDPELREQLRVFQARLELLELSDQTLDPPQGLAERTVAAVNAGGRDAPPTPVFRRESAIARVDEPTSRWTAFDAIVVAGVMLLTVSLFFPAVLSSRSLAHRTVCENNLRQLHQALSLYSAMTSDRRFPSIAPNGNQAFVGMVGPTLVELQLIDDSTLLICPSSPLSNRRAAWQVPTRAEIDRATGYVLRQLQRQAFGSYGYSLGVIDRGKYLAPRNEHRPYFALIADAPSLHLPGRRSVNHGVRGQNVLLEDGHIQFLRDMPGPRYPDHPFLSRRGFVEPGRDSYDAVIGTSFERPFVAGYQWTDSKSDRGYGP